MGINKFVLTFGILFAGLTFAKAQESETMGLQEALKQKRIRFEAAYNDVSVHYLRPVLLTMVGLAAQPFKLRIKAGDILTPRDTSLQTMMITCDTTLWVFQGKTIKYAPYGMCTEPQDGAGRKGMQYRWNENSDKGLRDIARFINENRYFNPTGQQAVWCVADRNKAVLDIMGYDSIQLFRIISKVCQITGKPMPNSAEIYKAQRGYTQPEIRESIGGSFEFKFSKTKKIHIAMFNPSGTLVRELYFNSAEPPGVKKVEFEFDYTQYTESYYTIKLIADEEVFLSSVINRNDNE